jgi:hypothetical protein
MQADSLASMNRAYMIRNDARWSPIARYFANLPDGYDRSDAYDRYMVARRATIDELSTLAPAINSLLSPEQRRKLPSFIASYLDQRYLASIKPGTATFTGSGGFGGFIPFGGGDAAFVSAVGGAQTVIISH